MLKGYYEISLVIVSIIVAIFASYTALSLAGRVTRSQSNSERWWIAGGAVAMGIGIWSMHFIGMLAFRLPIPVGYDLAITLLSLALPISVSGLALWHISRPLLPFRRLLSGAVLMGIGINAMHYTGMAAMRMQPSIQYDPWLFAASVIIAIVASGAAIWIAYRLRQNVPNIWIHRGAAAVAMGIAIVGMHYTGMAAAHFPAGSVCMAANDGFSQDSLAVMVIIATLGVLTVAMLTSVYDARLESRAQMLALSETTSADRQSLLIHEREARTQAERINVMKDEFLAVISHELRTPLNAIVGWTQILKHGITDEATLQKGIETIERNARAQAELIDDLLDMSKIISAKVMLEIQSVDPVALIDAVVETIRPAATAKNIRIEKFIDFDALPISGDMRRLQQVLWNLLSNAVKFTPECGDIRVYLQHSREVITIKVEDSGVGIDPAFLPYVFDRFRQADASITRRYGGLGLGLSIVKNLVELHGGSVHVTSHGEGQGAVFSVVLPTQRVSAGSADSHSVLPSARQPLAADPEVKLNGIKVLVIDDAADTLDLLERLLIGRGATALTAKNAGQGLLAVERERPDVIVSDIGMPDMDGYEFIQRVRSLGQERGGTVPAIALTAFTRLEDKRRALASGFTEFMSKPVEPEAFLSIVAASVRS
jgi:NO-binding membrane sensor protein with MHYT domain/CheY-like chemotaxis protein/two-component sensor histidine kinase